MASGDVPTSQTLNHYLFKDICKELIADYYDSPNAFYSFLLSGKEPFQAFVDVCKSVESLEIGADTFTACFYNPGGYETLICAGTLTGSKGILLKNLFKYTRSLNLRLTSMKSEELDDIVPHLENMQNLEELQLDHQTTEVNADIGPFIHKVLASIGPVKSITSSVSVFEAISRVFTDYKFGKMSVTICNYVTMERLLMLSNIFPTELNITSEAELLTGFCQQLNFVHNSPNFDGVEKMTFRLHNLAPDINLNASLVYDVIELIENRLPNLVELIIEHGFGHSYMPMNWSETKNAVEPSIEEVQGTIRLLENKLKSYPGRLRLKISLFLNFERDVDEISCENFYPYLADMRNAMSDYHYSLDIDDHYLKRTCDPRENVTFNSEILIHETELTSEDRYQIACDAGFDPDNVDSDDGDEFYDYDIEDDLEVDDYYYGYTG